MGEIYPHEAINSHRCTWLEQ